MTAEEFFELLDQATKRHWTGKETYTIGPYAGGWIYIDKGLVIWIAVDDIAYGAVAHHNRATSNTYNTVFYNYQWYGRAPSDDVIMKLRLYA